MTQRISPSRIAVVVLHYGKPSLAQNLASALLKAEADAAVRVLDNAAPKPYPSGAPGQWVRLEENRYWAGAFEYAAVQARKEGFSHLWFMNNDIRFITPGPYTRLAAGRMDWMARQLGRPVGVYSPAAQRNPYHPQMVAGHHGEGLLTPFVDGIAPLLSLDCLETIGGLDCADNPEGYGVDIWLSLRAHRAGWPVAVDWRLVLKHSYHTTAAGEDGFLSRAALREDAYMARRLGPDWREQLKALRAERREL